MQRSILCILIILAASQIVVGQQGFIARWHISGGMAFPSAPDQFYDYWKQGFQMMVGAELSGQSQFVQIITAEVNYFPFDGGRFLKRSGVDPSTTVTGSNAFIFSAAYLIKYSFRDYPSFQPSFFAGLGAESSFRTSGSVEYVGYRVTQQSTNVIVPVIPFGALVKLYEGEASRVELGFTYRLGLSKKQTVNSNYSGLVLDVAFSN